jgi:glucose-1-phosphate cytidylyltransferase
LNTMTGGRLKRVKDYISGEPFLMTYGDGVSDVDINECIRFHEETGTMVTLTGVLPEGRFGVMDIDVVGTDEACVGLGHMESPFQRMESVLE